ncbi:hypothetical protein WJX77_003474 [Trebouxia sp. C0004]
MKRMSRHQPRPGFRKLHRPLEVCQEWFLRGARIAVFRNGHPMVYSGAIDRVVGKPQPQAGDAVLVTDGSEAPIAWGVFNPTSMFRVRIMQLEHEANQQHQASLVLNVPELIANRLRTAVQLRTSLALGTGLVQSSLHSFSSSNGQTAPLAATSQAASANGTEASSGLPTSTSTSTSGADSVADSSSDRQASGSQASTSKADSKGSSVYRVVNSEGDRLSGLIVDRLGDELVVASSAAWVERYRDVITQQLQKACGTSRAPVWRQSKDMLLEEGIQITAQQSDSASGAAPTDAQVQVLESGIKFWVSPSTGQKTGFYADQRDSRLAIRHLSQGKAVLDLCCYTGGFALNALAGGAHHVTGVDSSAPALALAKSNAQLNGWQQSEYHFLKDDVVKYMQQQIVEGMQWDLVVLDPPKLAPNRKSLNRALAKYRKLNTLAMRVLRPGGLLMTCSCSGAVTLDDHFLPALKEAARAAGRHFSILRSAGSGPDHPIDPGYPEGAYLKNVLLLVA